MKGKNFFLTRLWIIISSIFGIILMTVIVGFYFYLLREINTNPNSSIVTKTDAQKYLITNYGQLGSVRLLLYIVIVWNFFKTWIFNVGLIKLATGPDEELVKNKWSLAVLSLTLGGFLAPFALTRLPNVDSKSTKNARVLITRYFGTAGWVGCIGSVFAMLLLLPLIGNANRIWTGNSQITFYGVMGGLIAGCVLLLLVTFPFYSQKIESKLLNKEKGYKKYLFIANFFTVIATIELIWLIIHAILKFLEAVGELSQAQGINKMMAVMRMLLIGVSVMFQIWIIVTVIKGLWRKEDGGYIRMGEYSRYTNYRQNRNTNRNNNIGTSW